jgi:hypothetical protein
MWALAGIATKLLLRKVGAGVDILYLSRRINA